MLFIRGMGLYVNFSSNTLENIIDRVILIHYWIGE